MKIDIIKIGNSQGIRIPKTIMEQCGFSESVEIEIKDGNLVLKPAQIRVGWAESFKLMAANKIRSVIKQRIKSSFIRFTRNVCLLTSF